MQTNIMLKEFKLWGSQTPPFLPSRLRWQLGWPLGKHRATLQVGDCLAKRQLLRRRNRIGAQRIPVVPLFSSHPQDLWVELLQFATP